MTALRAGGRSNPFSAMRRMGLRFGSRNAFVLSPVIWSSPSMLMLMLEPSAMILLATNDLVEPGCISKVSCLRD